MMTKQDILNLIEEDTSKALVELLDIIPSSELDALCDEFEAAPKGLIAKQFRSRLHLFVSRRYPKQQNNSSEPKKNHFDLLCKLDLEPQSTIFANSYKSRSVSSVLLYGEDDKDHLNWLYNQLLIPQELKQPIKYEFDFSGDAMNSYEDIIKELSIQFKLDEIVKNDDLEDWIERVGIVRNIIENQLQTQDLIFLIKYPPKTPDLNQFYAPFYKFYSKLKKENANKLIFFLIDGHTESYSQDLRMSNYFIWVDADGLKTDAALNTYAATVCACKEAKIIDLALVENIKVQTILNWKTKNVLHHITDEEIHDLLADTTNRYQVINKLYQKLQNDTSKNLNQCLKY
jgi:hypothetical protein